MQHTHNPTLKYPQSMATTTLSQWRQPRTAGIATHSPRPGCMSTSICVARLLGRRCRVRTRVHTVPVRTHTCTCERYQSTTDTSLACHARRDKSVRTTNTVALFASERRHHHHTAPGDPSSITATAAAPATTTHTLKTQIAPAPAQAPASAPATTPAARTMLLLSSPPPRHAFGHSHSAHTL